jgi:prevent-host-death family protein
MTSHSVAEARNHLSGLIDRALEGEDIVITRHGTPVVELRVVDPRPKAPQSHCMTPEDIAWLRSRRVGKIVPEHDAGQFVSAMRDEDEERLLRR